MSLEVATYISDLNTSNPDGSTDTVSTLDDHVKLIKSTLKTTFPNVTGAVTVTHNVLNGVSPAFTGTPTAPTATAGTNTTQIATTAFVNATAFTTATGLTAASQAEMQAGTEVGLRAMSPLRVAQAIAALETTPTATQADMETATSTTVFATPGRTQYHPGVAKAWVQCNTSGAVAVSHNITSVTDDGVGIVTATIGTDFSSANFIAIGTADMAAFSPVSVATKAAGSVQFRCFDTAGNVQDPTGWNLVFFGDQA